MNPSLKKTTLLLIFCLAYPFLASAQTTFQNPVISGLASDPSICRVGDDYYLVTSTFEYFPGLPIYQSKDLVHWKMIGYALSRASQNPLIGCEAGTGGQYAPTIRYHNGIFYVIGTNYGGQGSQGVFYVTATNPAGPWSNPIWVGNWYVDPSLMFENDSTYFHSPDNNGSFLIGTINPVTGKFITPLKKIAEGLGGSSPEGPHMYKINGFYYLMSAEGGTGYDHREVIQRSSSPRGPFEPSPVNPVVSHRTVPNNPFQAIGHADLVQLPDSSWWLVSLGFRPRNGQFHHLGRETFLAPVTWNAEGWPKVMPNGIIGEEMTAPNLPQFIWEAEPEKDNFDSTKLGLNWNFVRNPANYWSLTDSAGFLKLKGSTNSFKEKNSPAFVCRRQTTFNLLASAKIGFVSAAVNEEAGLVIRGDDANHYDFLITSFAGKKVIMLRQNLKGKVISLNYREIPDGDIILRISADDANYKFWIQEEGKTAELIGTTLTKNLSTEVIGGFTGVFIGMYASGNGKINTYPAYFDWFEFVENPLLPFEWAAGSPVLQNNMETPSSVSTTTDTYDKILLVWKNISNETAYSIERFDNGGFVEIATTNSNDTVFTDTNLTGNTLYIYRITGKNELGLSVPSVTASALTFPAPAPYGGFASIISGKIEIENYDAGPAGVVYFDTDAGNSGGKYRSEDVDIEACSDLGGGYDIGWTSASEWLIYTVDVIDTLVDIDFRVASSYGGKLRLELDGKLLGDISFTATGGWGTWKTFSLKKVKLVKGLGKKLKVSFLAPGFNINWISFTKVSTVNVPEYETERFIVYPNPAKGKIFLKSEISENSVLEIYNSHGSKVLTCRNSGEIDLSGISKGIYLIKLIETGKIAICKFVKE
jgi:alpha-N-arabinofuranosidase